MELVFNEQNLRKICNINNVNCIVSVVTEDNKKCLEALKTDGSRVALTVPQTQDKFPNQPIEELKKSLGHEFAAKFTTMMGAYAINIYNFECFEYKQVTKKDYLLYVKFKNGEEQKIMNMTESAIKSFRPITDRMARTIYAVQQEKAESLGV